MYVRGVPVGMVIDSGASANVIDKYLWQNLKKKHIKCTSRGSTKKLYAYGSTGSLTVIETFTAEVNVAGKAVTAELTVIQGKGELLLGRKTGIELGVLIKVTSFRTVREQFERSCCKTRAFFKVWKTERLSIVVIYRSTSSTSCTAS